MKTGPAGLQLLESFEKCSLVAYLDAVRIPTIGWGHTKGVQMGDTCTQDQANAWLMADLTEAENSINGKVTTPLAQNQFDALASLVYNIGVEDFITSTLLKYLNQNKMQMAASEFLRWNKARGVVLMGLVRRRKAERDLFCGVCSPATGLPA